MNDTADRHLERDAIKISNACYAANHLSSTPIPKSEMQTGDVMLEITCHRASAIGWQDVVAFLSGPYKKFNLLTETEARRDRVLCSCYSREAFLAAKSLCRKIRLPAEYLPGEEMATTRLWYDFLDLYSEVRDFKLCWVLIVSNGSAIEGIQLPALYTRNQQVMDCSRRARERFRDIRRLQGAALRPWLA